MRVLIAGGDRSWYSMQLATATLASRGPFPRSEWEVLRRALCQAGRGLAYAHSMDVVHRDLSPWNVLDVGDRWVIADWGLGQVALGGAGRLTLDGQIFGTPAFTAPEVFVDPRRATTAADVYSLGRLAAWGASIERTDHEAPGGLHSAAWQEFVDGTTDIDPHKRWSLPGVLAYLGKIDFAERVLRDGSVDLCPHCRSDVGYDSGARCLRCHLPNPSYA
jgi:serine/threonine-protein kinase